MSEDKVRAAFAAQAEWARRLDAPFTACLCDTLARVLDQATGVGQRVLGWTGDPRADALVLRLLGGLHALVRNGDLPDLAACYPPNPLSDNGKLVAALAGALADIRLLPWLDGPPQTNEVARSAVLGAGLLVVAAATGLPLRLFELGASAGLNLRLDHYRLCFADTATGPADADVVLTPDWRGPPPPIVPLDVVARRGVDLTPVDLSDAAGPSRLLAYVWPDQPGRRARLTAAIAAFADDPAVVDRGDAAAWVEQRVAPQAETATVVLHSIAWQYFPAATQARIVADLTAKGAAATAAAPLAWLCYEFETPDSPAATLRLRSWPGGTDRLLARAHPHAAWVEWLG